MPKMYLKEFKYDKGNGPEARKVFVIKESECNFMGIDFKYLDEEQQKIVLTNLKDKELLPLSNRDKIEGYDPAWNKAWRNFTKAKEVKEKSEEKTEEKADEC